MSSDDVQEFTLTGADPEGPKPPIRAGAKVWLGPVPWACVAVVLVLLGVVVAPGSGSPVDPWGHAEDVTTTPVAAWQMSDSRTIRSALLTEKALVLVRGDEVAGVDTATGEQLWSHPMNQGTCTTDSHTVVCADGGDRAVEWAADTGATVGKIEVGSVLTAARAEGDWFIISARPGRTGRMARYSGGDRVWSTPVQTQVAQVPFGNTLTVVAGSVLSTTARIGTEGHASGAVLDAATGVSRRGAVGVPAAGGMLRQSAPGVWTGVSNDSGTLFVRGVPSPATTSAAAAQLEYDAKWRSDRQPRFLGEEGGYGIFDTTTDHWVWRDHESGRPFARLDDTLLTVQFTRHGPPTMIGREIATGEELWHDRGIWLECPCVGDEETLAAFRSQLHVGSSGEIDVQSRQLVGLRVRTGQERWSLDVPQSTFALLTGGDKLIAVSSTGVQAWKLA